MFEVFSKRLQYLIDRKKINQKTLVDELHFTQAQISKWVSGAVGTPRRTTLHRLSDFFGCNIEWLATGKGEIFPTAQAIKIQKSADHSESGAGREIKTQVAAKEAEEDWSVSEMLVMTSVVLESKTKYKSVLASNVRALHAAVQREEEMKTINEKLEAMVKENKAMAERIARMEEMLLSLGAKLPEKREASNG